MPSPHKQPKETCGSSHSQGDPESADSVRGPFLAISSGQGSPRRNIHIPRFTQKERFTPKEPPPRLSVGPSAPIWPLRRHAGQRRPSGRPDALRVRSTALVLMGAGAMLHHLQAVPAHLCRTGAWTGRLASGEHKACLPATVLLAWHHAHTLCTPCALRGLRACM